MTTEPTPLPRPLSVLTGVPVRDLPAAIEWYTALFGRAPDLLPVNGVVEWFLTSTSTLQLLARGHGTGHAVVRLEVEDLDAAVAGVVARGLTVGESGEIAEVVRFAELTDPSGNEVTIVQTLLPPEVLGR